MNAMTSVDLTLADVRALVPRLYSPASAKVYLSALDRVEHLTGRKLASFLANDKAWAEVAARIVWSGEFRSRNGGTAELAFRAWVGKVGAAIRAARKHLTEPVPVDTALIDAWQRFEDLVKLAENKRDENGRIILAGQTSLSVATLRNRLGHVHPAEIDLEAATAAFNALPADKAASYRRGISCLNGMIQDRARLGAIDALLPAEPIVGLPRIRDEKMDWSLCTKALNEAIHDAITIAIRGRRRRRDRFGGVLGPDRLAAARSRTKNRKKPVRNAGAARKNHMSALSWLARHGFQDRKEVYALTSLEELLSCDTVEAALRRFKTRTETEEALADAKKTSSIITYLSSLRTLAVANNMDEDLIFAIEDAPYEVFGDGFESAADRMSSEREKFVKLIERDREKVRAIVRGPRVLAAEARRRFARWDELGSHERTKALHICMAACAMALQLSRPIRTKNINEMKAFGDLPELIPPARKGEQAWIDIGRDRVKNRRSIEHPLPEWAWDIVCLWLDKGRALWIAHNSRTTKGCVHFKAKDNDFLFPGVGRDEEISRGLFNKAWNRGVADCLGLRGLDPHVMRHVGATIYLARRPGRYSEVASLLGDEERTVEAFYARGAGREAAELFASVLVEIDPLLKLHAGLERRP
jgi:integrase